MLQPLPERQPRRLGRSRRLSQSYQLIPTNCAHLISRLLAFGAEFTGVPPSQTELGVIRVGAYKNLMNDAQPASLYVRRMRYAWPRPAPK